MGRAVPVRVSFEGKAGAAVSTVAWVEVDNPPVNATSTDVRAGLAETIAAVEQSEASVAILVCAGRTFVAGGDMSEFDAAPQPPHLPDVVTRIENSTVPWIAAMHGTVLGGGFEIAMGCAYRIAATGTQFGLPEVSVGLIPGAGGTQRLPRLVPMEMAIDIACRGGRVAAETLLDLGALDAIAGDDLRAEALAFAHALPPRPVAVSARPASTLAPDMLEAERAKIAARAKGQGSPLSNFDALAWSALPFTEGQPKERARHLDLRDSAESRALRHAFFAERVVARPAAVEGVTPGKPQKIVVVGGGLMGAGIASAVLHAGCAVTLIERDADAADAARARVIAILDGALKRGKISESGLADRTARLTVAADYAAAAGHDLAIEAVFEDVGVKQDVFRQLAAVMPGDAILATNTSYLDPTDIFAGIAGPERCLGLHFFSPAHIMKLLEVVRLPDTSIQTLATGVAFGKRLRKVAVLAGICDGFIGNRMLAAYRREAEYLLADGALTHQIDAAMRGYGYAMGPFEAQDMSGLQIAWANRKAQALHRDPAQRYVTIADQLCAAERFGQRSGKGWYDYTDATRKPQRSAEVDALIAAYSAAHGITRRDYSDDEIAGRLLAVLVNEGMLIVEEGIAENDAAVDMVQIHGYGFPRWRGGPMHYATEIGLEPIAKAMERVDAESPGSWIVAKKLNT